MAEDNDRSHEQDSTDEPAKPDPTEKPGSRGVRGDQGPPDLVGARDRVRGHLIGFVRALRGAGVQVPTNAGLTAMRALVVIGFRDEQQVRAALKAALVSRKEDIAVFDRLFGAFWHQLTDDIYARETGGEDNRENVGGFAPIGADSSAEGESEEPPPTDERNNRASGTTRRVGTDSRKTGERIETAVYSPTGASEPLSLADIEPDETVDRALSKLTDALAAIAGRRWEAATAGRADVRRALRGSFETGGTVVTLPQRARRATTVRCLFLVDVSRSVLDTIDRRFLMAFLRATTAAWDHTRTFLFDTDLMEVSAQLATPTPEATLEAFARAEAQWGGGTRIGTAIDRIRREHPNAADRRTTVFVISDGLEMGDIDLLESGVGWLSRRANALFWCNPLAASPVYEPTCRGMAVSMPYLDGLFAFSGPEDVVELARQLDRRGTTRVGYEYDPRRVRV